MSILKRPRAERSLEGSFREQVWEKTKEGAERGI